MSEESERIILARLEGKLDAHAGQLQSHVEHEREWQEGATAQLAAIDRTLRGNGTQPGINLRLDRVEQREKGRARVTWIAVAAAFSALGGLVKGWVTK
jgi:hypothetical protein